MTRISTAATSVVQLLLLQFTVASSEGVYITGVRHLRADDRGGEYYLDENCPLPERRGRHGQLWPNFGYFDGRVVSLTSEEVATERLCNKRQTSAWPLMGSVGVHEYIWSTSVSSGAGDDEDY